MFNWTNFDQVAQHETIKPHFEEVGPYVFEEYHERVGVEFLEDNEYVAFNQTKTWKFRPDLSVGSTSDRIFNLNPITAVRTLAFYTNADNKLFIPIVSQLLGSFNSG